jgi:transposase
MMRVELWQQIHALHRELSSIRAVARHLGVHRKTVREAIRSDRPPRYTRADRGSLIDPYRGWILGKLEQYPDLTAARLFHMLQERKYSGGYSVVKRCVRELRPRVLPAHFTMEFAPGECAQADWGCWRSVDVHGGRRRLSFFVIVLCHSRMLYVEFFYGEAMEHWLAAHKNAFEFFGCVPAKVLVDTCKTAVTRPAIGDQPAVYNTQYLDFAAHYGFTPIACTRKKPNQKGRVENAVGYVRTSFLEGREPASIEAMNPAIAHWRDTVANVRVHGTTGRRPVDLFTEVDRAALRPLPVGPHPCAAEKTVAATSRFRIMVDTNRYSVPAAFASRKLTLRLTAGRVTVYDGQQQLIADHPRSYAHGQTILNPDHERDLILRTRHARDQHQLGRFLTLGSAADAYLTGLRERRPDWRSHVRRINALVEIHGRDEVARLLADACEHHAFSSEYVLNILDARNRMLPEPGALHLTRGQDLLEIELPEPNMEIY